MKNMMRIIAVVCTLFVTAGMPACSSCGASVGRYGHENGVRAVDSDCNGPTVVLGLDKEGTNKNPASSFMYFIPLISPVPVERQTSDGNEQRAAIISYERRIDNDSFYAACEFKMWGKGCHFNPIKP